MSRDGQTHKIYGCNVVDGMHCLAIDYLHPDMPVWVEATALRVGTADDWKKWDARAKR